VVAILRGSVIIQPLKNERNGMIIKSLVCIGFMFLGATFSNETFATASIVWNGLVTMVKQIGTVIV
jgi:hypothetical protein